MKTRLRLVALTTILLVGCSRNQRPTLKDLYATPSLPQTESADKLKASPLKVEIPLPFAQVWESTLVVLSQFAVVQSLSKEGERSGRIRYVDVDALVHKKDAFLVDMAFVVLVEEEVIGSTMVYVSPQIEHVEGKYPKERMEAVRDGMEQKGKWLLNRVVTQALAERKWRWLVNVSGGQQ